MFSFKNGITTPINTIHHLKTYKGAADMGAGVAACGELSRIVGMWLSILDNKFFSRCRSVLSFMVPSFHEQHNKLSAHSRMLGQHLYFNPQLHNLQQSRLQEDISHLGSFKIYLCHLINTCFIKLRL